METTIIKLEKWSFPLDIFYIYSNQDQGRVYDQNSVPLPPPVYGLSWINYPPEGEIRPLGHLTRYTGCYLKEYLTRYSTQGAT